MKSSKIVYAFLDSQNLNLGIKVMGWELDFKKFNRYLKDKYKVIKTFLFIGYVGGNETLYTHLQEAGFIVIFKPTLEFKKKGNLVTKGNVDAELVLHTMIEFPNYDQAVIVSADGDFYCLLEYLEDQKKLKHLIMPNPKKYSALLRKFRPYFIFLDSLKKKLGKIKERE